MVTHGVNLITSSVPSKYSYIVKNIDGSEEALWGEAHNVPCTAKVIPPSPLNVLASFLCLNPGKLPCFLFFLPHFSPTADVSLLPFSSSPLLATCSSLSSICRSSLPDRFITFLVFQCNLLLFYSLWASLVAQLAKNLPAAQETRVRSLGWKDSLEKEMATHSSNLAWRIPVDRRAWQARVHGVAKN